MAKNTKSKAVKAKRKKARHAIGTRKKMSSPTRAKIKNIA